MAIDAVVGIGGLLLAASTALIAWLQLRQAPSTGRDVSRRRLSAADPNASFRPPNGRIQGRIQGRDAILSQLSQAISDRDGKVRILVGMGGVGKSSIALQIALSAGESGRQVWWIESSNQSNLTSSLLGLAAHLGASSVEIEECLSGIRNPSDVLWLRLNQRKGWVLVLDNVDDLTSLTAGDRCPGDGNGWLRSTTNGSLIVTSREENPIHWGSISWVLKVETLSKEAGGKVLLDLAPGAGTYESAQQVAAKLGGLPLALAHAGRYISTQSVVEQSFDSYLQELGNGISGLLENPPQATRSQRGNIYRTWDMSLELLDSREIPDPRQAILLLSLCSSPHPIPVVVFQAGVRRGVLPRSFLSSTLPSLAGVGLATIQRMEMQTRYHSIDAQVFVHPVVSEITASSGPLAHVVRCNQILLSCVESVIAELDREDPSTWVIWTSLVPHIAKMLDSTLGQEEESANGLLHVTARVISSLAVASEHPKSEDLVEKARRYVSLFSADSIVSITARYCIAHAARTRSYSYAGEEEFRQILAVQSSILGSEHPDSLHTRHNLAHTLAAKGGIGESILEFSKTIEARTRVLGAADQLTISSRRALLFYLIRAGRLAQAREQYDATLILACETFPADHPAILSLRQRRAEIDILEGSFVDLEEELCDILEMQRIKLGHSHSCTVDTLLSLADVLEGKNQFDRAMASLTEALEYLRVRLGPDHPRVTELTARVSSLHRRNR